MTDACMSFYPHILHMQLNSPSVTSITFLKHLDEATVVQLRPKNDRKSFTTPVLCWQAEENTKAQRFKALSGKKKKSVATPRFVLNSLTVNTKETRSTQTPFVTS